MAFVSGSRRSCIAACESRGSRGADDPELAPRRSSRPALQRQASTVGGLERGAPGSMKSCTPTASSARTAPLRGRVAAALLALGALACLCASAAPAIGAEESARKPTGTEDAGLLPVLRAETGNAWGGRAWFRTRISTVDPRYAGFSVNARPGFRGQVQTAWGFARRRGTGWVIVGNPGGDRVGCGLVPNAVRRDLARALLGDPNSDRCY